MYSIHNKEKFVVAERIIWTLKSNIYNHVAAVSKNMYIDKLDEVVKKFKNRYHRTIKMKPVDSRSDTYIEYGVEHNDQDLKFKVSNFVRMSK